MYKEKEGALKLPVLSYHWGIILSDIAVLIITLQAKYTCTCTQYM